MTDRRVYTWSGPELAMIELVLADTPDEQPAAPLRSLSGFEPEVSCLLESTPPTSSREVS